MIALGSAISGKLVVIFIVSEGTLFQVPAMHNARFVIFVTKWAGVSRSVMLVFHMHSNIGGGGENTQTLTTPPGDPVQFLKIRADFGLLNSLKICNQSEVSQLEHTGFLVLPTGVAEFEDPAAAVASIAGRVMFGFNVCSQIGLMLLHLTASFTKVQPFWTLAKILPDDFISLHFIICN